MTGRVVIVTGTSGVLGQAVARRFRAAGDRVAGVDQLAGDGDMALELALTGVDLTSAADALTWVETCVARLGSPAVLINAVGGFAWQTLEDGDATAAMFAINVATAVNMSRAVLPHLRLASNGRIVNVGAYAALRADAGMGAYAVAKSALHRLTESLAAETINAKVTVNTVLPTILDTPRNRDDMPDADRSTWLAPSTVADAIYLLASPLAQGITGALVPIMKA